MWLRKCIYDRILKRGGSGIAIASTYVTSAFWHGFYPGYYVCFLIGVLANLAARKLRRHIRPLFASPTSKLFKFKAAYDFLGWFATSSLIAMVTATFQVLTLEKTLKVYNSVFWYSPHLEIIP
ncbi:lysophospholipid acyltransferase [Nowakowskiella sp. JEL0078]|nr:lysophospholipid acyltransferase [Nowakowskiella sp. JEL0078]